MSNNSRIQFMISPKELELVALEQIQDVISAFTGSEFPHIAIMSDAHYGMGSVIGFTSKVGSVIIPGSIGVDIGCAVSSMVINKKDIGPINFKDFDRYIKEKVPMGMRHRERGSIKLDDEDKVKLFSTATTPKCFSTHSQFIKAVETQIATLGGGNHFCEIEESETEYYFTVHTGSRNLGLKTARYHIKKAQELSEMFKSNIKKDLEYLPFKINNREGIYKYAWNYIDDMETAQFFAHLNRKYILRVIESYFSVPYDRIIESVHNYIEFGHSPQHNFFISRKGAISAYEGEELIIPLNMADGVIIGTGKSSSRWNYSAPHGAGRISSRRVAFDTLSMDEFRSRMKGIYSSSVVAETLDESPMAYKDSAMIIESIKETVDIKEIIKPIYNIKAVEKRRNRKNKKTKGFLVPSILEQDIKDYKDLKLIKRIEDSLIDYMKKN